MVDIQNCIYMKRSASQTNFSDMWAIISGRQKYQPTPTMYWQKSSPSQKVKKKVFIREKLKYNIFVNTDSTHANAGACLSNLQTNKTRMLFVI